jgi:hypothetical protein
LLGAARVARPLLRVPEPADGDGGAVMAKVKPSIRPTETYTEPNFLRIYTGEQSESDGRRLATIEHLSYTAAGAGGGKRSGWSCTTIVDGEAMSKEDALFIARSYAVEHNIPVIYESHTD